MNPLKSLCAHRGILLLAILAPFAGAASGADLLPWPEIQQKIETHWAETAPTERVLSIARKGEPEYSASQRISNSTFVSSWWYDTWITTYKTIQGSFARQVALVEVERANKSRARFEIAALYRGEGESWIFDKIAVGPVTELGAPGDPERPTDAAALDIFRDAWARKQPDLQVKSMKLIAPPSLSGTPKRRVLRYRLEVAAVGTEKASKKYRGQSLVCKPADYSSVLIWDAKSGTWRADESMIQIINEDRVCDIR